MAISKYTLYKYVNVQGTLRYSKLPTTTGVVRCPKYDGA
jgi:hypothetical protein